MGFWNIAKLIISSIMLGIGFVFMVQSIIATFKMKGKDGTVFNMVKTGWIFGCGISMFVPGCFGLLNYVLRMIYGG